MTTPATSFKDENRPLVEMVREWKVLRDYNVRFKDGDDQSEILAFAEGAIVCMICEHFVRMVVYRNFPDAPPGMQLRGLLDYAIARNLFRLPFADQEAGKTAVCNHRNALLHGNFGQAATQAGCSSIAEYFRTRYFAEVHAMTMILDTLMRQIDVATGERIPS